ncbi:hypothetical protein ACH5RR_036987 [Cinchona calisaya]|uniref:PB1-like domain-containing protein n=1 Tax=Cinchona calisaya TaxID=153742 RepID=A0ABD2Y634_9GENT
MRCCHWGKCKHEPSATYDGEEITVFDEVELSRISIFELDRMVEQAGVYGHKRYYMLIEDHGFRELTHSRELQEHCQDFLQVDKMVELYIEESFKEINVLQCWGWGTEDAGNGSDEAAGTKSAEDARDSDFFGKDSDF